MKTSREKFSRRCGVAALVLAIPFATAFAQEPKSNVSGVAGVKQDAVGQIKPVTPKTPPPPNSSSAQRVNKVDGIETIDGVKASGRVVPLPPTPTVSGDTIRAVKGGSGIDTTKLQNLEAALILKDEGGGTPAGGGAELGGKGKAAAAALLSAPGDKLPVKPQPKQDGRAGFQEFEKLQNRGS